MPFSKAPHPSRRFASDAFPVPASWGEGIRRALPAIASLMPLLWPAHAQAAELNGAELLLPWAVPFVGILLSIALLPLLAHHFWEHHQGKIAAFWAALV